MPDLETALELRAAGRHEDARDQLLRLAAEAPTDARVQLETACVHDHLGQERDAVPFYLTALRLGLPDDLLRQAYLGLGSTYRTLGQYHESKETLAEGLKRFPEAAELRVFLAMTLYNLAEHHAAMSSLLTVLANTSADEVVQRYTRAIRFYAEDLDRRWE